MPLWYFCITTTRTISIYSSLFTSQNVFEVRCLEKIYKSIPLLHNWCLYKRNREPLRFLDFKFFFWCMLGYMSLWHNPFRIPSQGEFLTWLCGTYEVDGRSYYQFIQSRHCGNLHWVCCRILHFAANFKGKAGEIFDLCVRHILVWLQGLRVWQASDT